MTVPSDVTGPEPTLAGGTMTSAPVYVSETVSVQGVEPHAAVCAG